MSTGSVLIIDDEPLMRLLAVRDQMLRKRSRRNRHQFF